MDQPRIADTCPSKVELEEGKKYAFCTCGLSENQPYCDGKHSGTNFVPIVFTAEESKAAYLCQCKHSKNGAYCDGTHNELTEAAE